VAALDLTLTTDAVEQQTVDRVVLRQADGLTTRVFWADGLATVDFRGTAGQPAYQSTIVNGGELRSYDDGRMAFRTADGRETILDFSASDVVRMVDPATGRYVDIPASGFDWNMVSGFSGTWGDGTAPAAGATPLPSDFLDDFIGDAVIDVSGALRQAVNTANSTSGEFADDGDPAAYDVLTPLPRRRTFYNVEVAGRHTYVAGGYRVHNKTSAGAPVILDLDGDGVELVNLSRSSVFFDMVADGFLENTGWAAPWRRPVNRLRWAAVIRSHRRTN